MLWRRLLFLFGLVALLATPSAASGSGAAEEALVSAMRRGQAARERGDLDGAREAYGEAVAAAAPLGGNAAAEFNLASVLTTQQRWSEAARHYEACSRLDRTSGDVFFYLGYVLHQGGDASGAVSAYRIAETIDGDRFGQLGGPAMLEDAIARGGREDPARFLSARAEEAAAREPVDVQEEPDSDAMSVKELLAAAKSASDVGKFDKAAALLRRVVAERPTRAKPRAKLALALMQAAAPLSEIEPHVQAALDSASSKDETARARRVAAKYALLAGRPEDAVAHHMQYLLNASSTESAYEELLDLLVRAGLLSTERLSNERQGGFPVLHSASLNNLAAPIVSTYPTASVALLEYAVTIDQMSLFEIQLNLGDSLWALGHFERAIEQWYKAYGGSLRSAQAYHHLGDNLYSAYRYQMALESYRRALEMDETHVPSLVQISALQSQLADWNATYVANQERAVQISLQRLRESDVATAPLSPIQATLYPFGAADLKRVIGRHARALVDGYAGDLSTSTSPAAGERRPLRVGLMSGDFRKHPVGHLMSNMFPHIDTSRFDVFIYDSQIQAQEGSAVRKAENDPVRQGIERAVGRHRIIMLHGMQDVDVARRIQADGIDILIDMAGHTTYGRTGVLAHRPAPVQVQYLGFMGTTGADYVDYVLTDRVASPPFAARTAYTESMLYMPGHVNFMVSSHRQLHAHLDGERAVAFRSASGPTRADYGLPADAVVFVAFNRLEKVSPANFDAYLDIVERVPGSVLWLMLSEYTEAAREGVLRRVHERNFDASRVHFLPFVRDGDHVAIEQLGDVFLDSWRYSAGCTGLDILWAGLPLVTWPGPFTMSRRMAASFVTTLGLDDVLVADSRDAYVDIAVRFGLDADLRERVAERLWQARTADGGLYDVAGWVRAFESRLEAVWESARARDAQRGTHRPPPHVF